MLYIFIIRASCKTPKLLGIFISAANSALGRSQKDIDVHPEVTRSHSVVEKNGPSDPSGKSFDERPKNKYKI